MKVAPGAVTTPRGQGEVQDRAFLAPLPGALLATPRLGLLESPIGLDPYLSRTVDGILLHLLGHVRILNHCLPVRHAGGAEDGESEDQKEFKGSGNSPWAGLGGQTTWWQ